MSTYTEAQVLAHHNIAPLSATPTARIDAARAAGLITACLGCGSVQGINISAPLHNHASVEAARVATRDNLDLDGCCPDADSIVY